MFPMNKNLQGERAMSPMENPAFQLRHFGHFPPDYFFVHLGITGLERIPLAESCIEGIGHSIPKVGEM